MRNTVLTVLIFLLVSEDITGSEADTYEEELEIKRLNDGHLLSKFRFVITSGINLGWWFCSSVNNFYNSY